MARTGGSFAAMAAVVAAGGLAVVELAVIGR